MYTLPTYPSSKQLIYGISDVSEGNMSFSFNGNVGNYDEVSQNRKAFAAKIGVTPEEIVAMTVTHGTDCIEVTTKDAGSSYLDPDASLSCDALITSQKNVGLFLRIADCIPMILTDTNRRFLAVIHGGWKNTDSNLLARVVELAIQKHAVTASDLELILGPAIQKESYLYDYFDKKDTHPWKNFTEVMPDGKIALDNVGLTMHQALELGIPNNHIYNSGIDTYTDEQFFSHKRDFDAKRDDLGRFAILAILR